MTAATDTCTLSLELRLADAQLALDKCRAAQGEFVARITHELRTPLNAILGFTQILDSDGRLDERQKRHVSAVLASAHLLVNLIDNLLEPQSIDSPSGTQPPSAAPVEPEPAVDLDAAALPPREEIAVLHGLALAGSMREILERAQWIEALDTRYIPFTRHVAALARAYESQRVLSFIARHLERSNPQ